MSVKLMATYRWKVLSPDGLLKEPADAGPYHDPRSLNGLLYGGGFDTKEEAFAALIAFHKVKEYNRESVILITDYITREES